MPKRKLFSQKDGSTFLEDAADIRDDVKAFFNHLPLELKKLLPIAEDIVRAIQTLDDLLEEGEAADIAIGKVLFMIKGDVDDNLYELLKTFLNDFAGVAVEIFEEFEKWVTSFQKKDTAVDILSAYTGAKELQADTAIQLAVYAVKS